MTLRPAATALLTFSLMKTIESLAIAGSGDICCYGDPAVEKRLVGSASVRRLGAAPT